MFKATDGLFWNQHVWSVLNLRQFCTDVDRCVLDELPEAAAVCISLFFFARNINTALPRICNKMFVTSRQGQTNTVKGWAICVFVSQTLQCLFLFYGKYTKCLIIASKRENKYCVRCSIPAFTTVWFLDFVSILTQYINTAVNAHFSWRVKYTAKQLLKPKSH